MKLPLVATRLIIVAFKLMVAVIVILSILPLLNGGIGVDLDNGDEGEWSFEDGVIRMQVPFTVRNDGYFAINDLQVSFTFMDEEGTVLAESEGEPIDIPVGGDTEVDIELVLDLYDFDQQVRSDLIFNGTELSFAAEISAKYTLDMVQLSVEAGSDMGMGPFISDLQVGAGNAMPQEDGDDRYLKVPFSFRADDFLNGLMALAVTDYHDESGYDSNVTQTVQMSQQVNEMASIPLSQEAYDRLINGTANATVRTTLFFLDCSTSDEAMLNTNGGGGGGDPVWNLQIQAPSSYLEDMGGSYYVWVPFSYQSDGAHQGQYAYAIVEYWDSYGFYNSGYQDVYLDPNGGGKVQIWLSPEAYDAVYYGNEMVHFKLTMNYQYWSGYSETDYNEQWGV